MTRKQLPFFIGFFVLLFGATACACLGSGVGLGGAQATVNAALTQGSSLSGTAASAGNSAAATANAQATSAIATANAAGGGSTGAATATTASGGSSAGATATTGTTGGGSTGGAPSDIPVIEGTNTNLVITPQSVSYETKTDLATVVSFYKTDMPKNGWTADATTTIESANATILGFKKDSRTAVVTLGKDPSTGDTVVAIVFQ